MKYALIAVVILNCTTAYLPATIPRGIPADVWSDCHKQASIGLEFVRENVLHEQFDEIVKPSVKACTQMLLVVQCVTWRQAAEKRNTGTLSDAWCVADAAPFLERELREPCNPLGRSDVALAQELADTATEQILFAAERFGASVH